MADIVKSSEKLIADFAENYMEKIFYFCLKKTGSVADAEDLTQDIAFSILLSLDRGTVPVNFPAWVWRIARNRYARWAKIKHKTREAKICVETDESEPVDESESALDAIIRKEQLSLLRRELAFIGNEYRNIIVAYYIENKSVSEIAASLSLSAGAVKERLYRARNILKEGMDMAREFGSRSYNPEKIIYTNVCDRPGNMGQPWTLMDPKLNQNIFLVCYKNQVTARELAIELGVALPYMEDTLERLVRETLLIKRGNGYETNFPIISREAQEKPNSFYAEILPRTVSMLEENTDRLMEQYAEAGAAFYGRWVTYDEAKWVLLMEFYKELYDLCDRSPKSVLGRTERNDQGRWDVVAAEVFEKAPEGVGYHCQTNGFRHYRFGYNGIWNQTPDNLSEAETEVLSRVVGGNFSGESDIASKLEEFDYIRIQSGRYIPHIVVFDADETKRFLDFCDKKNFSERFMEHAIARGKLIDGILKSLAMINDKVNAILYDDLPRNIRSNKYLTDALTREICRGSCTLGYLTELAVKDGWLTYDADTSRAVGAYMSVHGTGT